MPRNLATLYPLTSAGRVTPIEQSFNHAAEKGYKRVTLRADVFRFSLAPYSGVNRGGVYVKTCDIYLGKIVNGRFYPSHLAPSYISEADIETIKSIANAPLESAIAWGQKTGECAICGRTLINEDSVAFGIGPICAEKLGLDVPKRNILDEL